ncbi:MAG: DUF4956 domain-containing protein [Sporomusa sp.]
MLDSILSTATESSVTFQELILCTGASLVLGIVGALVFMYKNRYSKGFVITLTLLPAIVQLVIMMVNGNVGTGVAVMGAFSLIRFRSVPGNAKEICSIFLAMGMGLATGMGYIGLAALFLVIIGIVSIILTTTPFGEQKKSEKMLKITIPEDLDYTDIFDDIFKQYTSKSELVRVKTTNMGSLYELQYQITLSDKNTEKAFIDDLRCRNGNLNIVCGRLAAGDEI